MCLSANPTHRRACDRPSLSGLPEEILLGVISSLDRTSLVYLATVNRKFWRLSVPILYQTFKPFTDNLHKFLRTLLERPELGDHIKDLSWGEDFDTMLNKEKDRVVVIVNNPHVENVTDGIAIVPALRRSGLLSALENVQYYEKLSDTKYMNCIEDIFIENVLLLAPNVSSFSFQTAAYSYRDNIPWKSPLSDLNTHGFFHLIKVKIVVAYDTLLLDMAPLFAHQSLQELEIVDLMIPVGLDVPILAASSNIKVLKFGSCLCPGSQLTWIIACCNLEVFMYEHRYYAPCTRSPLNFPVLAKSLGTHAHSLKHLAILDGGATQSLNSSRIASSQLRMSEIIPCVSIATVSF